MDNNNQQHITSTPPTTPTTPTTPVNFPLIQKRPSFLNHSNQDFTTDEWKQHKKHFFILSEAGRPIFTRYGNENDLNPIMSFFLGVMSLAQLQENDTLRTVVAGDLKIVFVMKGALHLVAVSKTTETEMELARQLDCIYDQIICILTDSIQSVLKKKASFDLRNLLGGTDAVLYSLMHNMSHTLNYSLKSVKPLIVSKQVRTTLGDILLRNKVPKLMFSLLISGDRLVHLIQNKKYTLQMTDLLLLMNFVNSSTSMRSSETWTPLCLPALSSSQYVYVYVNFLNLDVGSSPLSSNASVSSNDFSFDMSHREELCLVMICAGQDLFFECSNARKQIENQLKQNEIQFAQVLRAIQTEDFPVSKLGVMSESASLRHFVYRNANASQYTTSTFIIPYNLTSERKRLVREYKLVRQNLMTLCAKSNNKIFFQKTDHECILGMMGNSIELMASFSLTASKSSALLLCESIKKWVRREEETLFISSFPTFSV
jgi:hypothetical protein